MKYQTLFLIHLSEGAGKAFLLFMTVIVMALTINSGKWLTNDNVDNLMEHTPL
jgi:hypothetical protein